MQFHVYGNYYFRCKKFFFFVVAISIPFFFSGFFLFALFLGVGGTLLLDVLLPLPLDVSLPWSSSSSLLYWLRRGDVYVLLLFAVKLEGSRSFFGSDFGARADMFFLNFVEILFPGYKKHQKIKKKLIILMQCIRVPKEKVNELETATGWPICVQNFSPFINHNWSG